MAETTAPAGPGLPPQAAWEHLDGRVAFEVTFFAATPGGLRLEGSTTGVEDDRAWVVRYAIDVDDRWCTRRAEVWGRTASGPSHRLLETDGEGRWSVDGVPMAELDGCLDVDLEASACTNTLAVHRMALPIGGAAEAPAAYVRADGLAVERLEQRYDRPLAPGAGPNDAGDAEGLRLHYVATRFDYDATLVFDAHGLVLDYPGLARRAA